jgi:copper transport protein
VASCHVGRHARRSESGRGLSGAAKRWPLLFRAAVIFGLVVVLHLLGPVPAASAHATLLFTTPAVDGAVPSTPQQIQLVFDQPVRPLESSLQVTADPGQPVSLGAAVLAAKGQTVTAQVLAVMPTGRYLVR